jgi:hypothetical protein
MSSRALPHKHRRQLLTAELHGRRGDREVITVQPKMPDLIAADRIREQGALNVVGDDHGRHINGICAVIGNVPSVAARTSASLPRSLSPDANFGRSGFISCAAMCPPTIYLNALSAGVPAEARIRAWKEGDNARVVVYTVLSDQRAPTGETETAIATFPLAVGQSMTVPQTQKWGTKPIIVNLAPRLAR